MLLHNPAHPGELIKQLLIEDEDGKRINSVAKAAEQLSCHRNTLNQLISGKSTLSPDMALALEENNHGSAEHWLKMQMAYDLFHLRQKRAA